MLFYPYSSSDDEMTISRKWAMTNDKISPQTKDLSPLGRKVFYIVIFSRMTIGLRE
jgi:hypothetical protein